MKEEGSRLPQSDRSHKILDTKGWLGPEIIGQKGNTTLFLVIQHALLAIQLKYLPMMRAAQKAGNQF